MFSILNCTAVHSVKNLQLDVVSMYVLYVYMYVLHELYILKCNVCVCVCVCTFVILFFLNISRKAEVAQLHTVRRRHQDISDRYVSTGNRQEVKQNVSVHHKTSQIIQDAMSPFELRLSIYTVFNLIVLFT